MTLSLALWLVVLALLIIIIIAQWRYIVLSKRRQRELESKMLSLLEEKRALDEVLSHSGDSRSRDLIMHRARLIAQMLAAGVSGDARRFDAVMAEVDQLVSDRAEFMRQTRMVYEQWKPAMINRLRECGLTEEEMEICCLYALGLNGKTIQQYTRDGRHYQNVGLIRKKLGLGEHDKNIDGYIKSLLD